ncbi:MAG: hypothetical protein ACU0BB_04430 [Paracoccaceae bacterium]
MKRIVCMVLCLAAQPAIADEPVVEDVSAVRTGDTWQISVTLSHPDTGWDHYADGWRILDMDGDELGMRELHHPHVNEQPFTRSLPSVDIPNGMTQVQVQARDSVDGWAEHRTTVPLR